MAEQTPDSAAGAHRAGSATRSGDTHVIGADGLAVNVDQLARDAAEVEAAKAAKQLAPRAAKRRAPRAAKQPVTRAAEKDPVKPAAAD